MKSYTATDLKCALVDAGVTEGDVLYLSTQLFGIGPLEGATSKSKLLAGFYAAIREVVGDAGTLVVPTFTQQVGRFGVPYIHEETESLTGIFGEYVRKLPGAVRSLHPVFSVSAIGPRAADITENISAVAFGRNSAFDRLYYFGGKAVCIGLPFYSGHITSLMHYVETAFAVPYYYNKYVLADVFLEGNKIHKPFIINVKYNGVNCVFDYRRYIDALAADGHIREASVGSGSIFSVDIKRQIDTGFRLLSEDLYAFLAGPPSFQPGLPPLDGPPEAGSQHIGRNWSGFLIGA